MEKVIKNIIEKYNLDDDKSVILAVSGGSDSVALLDIFWRFYPKDKIIVAHANHGIRLESRWDENFVAQMCAEYGVKFVSERLNLKSTSEAEARESRYEFLQRVRAENGAKYILTAHHLNDQAETVLLSLTRGSGPLATWGMQESENHILRPFLVIPKKEIVDYVNKKHLRFHKDRTNYDLKYARNRLRAKVVPELVKINPKFLQNLSRNAQLGVELEEAWDQIMTEKQKKIESGDTLNIKKLQKEPIFVQKELIYRKLASSVERKNGFSAENVDKVIQLLKLQRGKSTEIGGLQIVRGTVYLKFNLKKATKVQERIKTQKLETGQTIKFGEFSLRRSHETGRASKNNILLPDSFGYNLTIRTWKDGDRITTKAGTKKLQDVFSDAKVPASKRKNWPILMSGQKILWVPELAASEVALSKAANKVLKIEVKHEG